jgi:DNA helicase-2/ATP-dependent DNA helicase PcrA
MILTEQQRDAVGYNGNTLLEACPGSGKTRAIVAKVLRCLEDVRDTPRKVAAITYTNAAVNEIEARLRRYSSSQDMEYVEVSTIHSFCIGNILNSFYWRLDDYSLGFRLLSHEDAEYAQIVRNIINTHGLNARSDADFQSLIRDANGNPYVTRNSTLTDAAARAFWEALRAVGAIDFATSIYLTYRILRDRPSLARALSCRFKWILVDEFQDTTDLQVEILKLIHQSAESQFFLVGDPHQSIYGFAGARPNLMPEFAEHIEANADFSLTENWRSNPQIVADAERLIPRNPEMESAGDIAADITETQYVRTADVQTAIEVHFLPKLEELGIAIGDAAILSPAWFSLIPIGRWLRDFGVPVIGPGARPYRGANLFARLAEHICAYLQHRDSYLIRGIQRELNRVVMEGGRVNRFDAFSYPGRVMVYRMLDVAATLEHETVSAEVWLNRAADAIGTVLVAGEALLPEGAEALKASAATMCTQMRANQNFDFANFTVADLGLFAAHGRSVHLMTYHGAKGLEFEAVALTGLNERSLPNHRAITPEELAESRRLFYVGITRAKRFLLYVSDNSGYGNPPSRFLGHGGLGLT